MYQHAKIYKITSDSSDKIYIGSTCNPLYKRLGQHRTNYKQFQNGKYHNVSSFEIIKLDDAIITLIEDYPCERKEQLHARERYHIELNKSICVNKRIPTRTEKEYSEANKDKIAKYYQANKDKIAEYNKVYNKANKDKISEHNKEYYQTNKDKAKEYRQANKEKISDQMKEYYQANKDKLYEKITCECGNIISKCSKTRHDKSKKHLAFIQSQS